MLDTTIVIPCYNEAQRLNIDDFVRHALSNSGHRFLFVNDGSTDETLDLLQELNEHDGEHFGTIDLPKNGGKAEAVRRGILAAFNEQPKYVGYWDADLATPLDEIERFREVLERRDDLNVVLGSRVPMLGRTIRRQRLRQLLGRAFAKTASFALGWPVFDTQCGAKLFRASETTRSLFATPFLTNWIFDVELLARLKCQHHADESVKDTLYELPLENWQDVDGSKVRPRDFLKAFFELLAIHKTYLRGDVVATLPQPRTESRSPTSRPVTAASQAKCSEAQAVAK